MLGTTQNKEDNFCHAEARQVGITPTEIHHHATEMQQTASTCIYKACSMKGKYTERKINQT